MFSRIHQIGLEDLSACVVRLVKVDALFSSVVSVQWWGMRGKSSYPCEATPIFNIHKLFCLYRALTPHEAQLCKVATAD